MRYEKHIIERLLKLKWWNKDEEKIAKLFDYNIEPTNNEELLERMETILI